MYDEQKARQYIKRIQDGDREAAEEFFTVIKEEIEKTIRINNYSVCGYDREDIIQSCWAKCWQFVKVFKLENNTRFIPVLTTVIHNHVKDLIKLIYYDKRKIIMYTTNYPDIPIDQDKEKATQYERLLIRDELDAYLGRLKKHCSKIEFAAFLLKLRGYSYQEIAETLFDGDTKMADNALSRIKNKMKKIKPVDFEGLFLHSAQSGRVTSAKFVEGMSYEDFDPDSGSYGQVARKLLEDV